MQKTKELQAVEKIVSGKKKEKKKLLEIFIRQTSKQIKQLKDCLTLNDWASIKKIVHAMKSTFIFANMTDAKELADNIGVTAGISKELTSRQVNELISICSRVLKDFKKELKTLE